MSQRLHLDLASGARADMICGALLAAGAPRDAALEALAAVGLSQVALEEDRVNRAGLRAVRARFVVDGGDLAQPIVELRARPPRHERRRAVPKPRLDGSPRGAALPHASENVDALLPRGLAQVARPAQQRHIAKVTDAWLAGAAARLGDVVHTINGSALSPVSKALAAKAARRMEAALSSVVGEGARVAGPRATRILAELVVNAALVEALGPAAITSSAIAISAVAAEHEGVVDGGSWPAPSPWLLEVLAGVPVVERDDPWAPCDVAGAAFAWACVHRFGARGVSSSSSQGIGAGGLDVPGHAVVARAVLGPPTPVASRAGEKRQQTALSIEAAISDAVDVERELTALGAREIHLGRGQAPQLSRVWALVTPEQAGAVARLLWSRGAADVVSRWVEVWSAGVQEVTVPVGRGRTRSDVRVRVLLDGDEVVRVEPNPDDVRRAAGTSGGEHAVAAEAVAAWQRLGRGRERDGDEEP